MRGRWAARGFNLSELPKALSLFPRLVFSGRQEGGNNSLHEGPNPTAILQRASYFRPHPGSRPGSSPNCPVLGEHSYPSLSQERKQPEP